MKRMAEDELRRRKFKKIEIIHRKTASSVARNGAEPSEFLPLSVGYGFMIVFCVIVYLFYVFETSLPHYLKIKDADSHPGRFIGERAELKLKLLTNLGTRVVGSYENEVLAVDFLKREVSFIASEAKKVHKIEVDVQKPTGSYYLKLKPHSFKNYYANIQNVVVKLSSGKSNNSVLMNCHYDTVPESPGASDNGLNCAVMLEILRVLASEPSPLKNNVIFLFNGAEENPLQASHGFLSQHKWRNEVKVVINLDSAGAGGREILFQTSGEPWLVKAYARAVPRPCAGVQAEELFQYGVIPSDTDFRIFRDFAGYPGFDIAHCTNGYVYHTKFDKVDFIQPGVYQNTGDNLLALLRELVSSPELEATHPKTRIVYFDVFTLFMIVYTEEASIFVNLAAVALSFFAVFRCMKGLTGANASSVKCLCFSVGMQFLGVLMACAFAFCTAKFLDFCGATMSWYSRPSLIVPLYGFPIVFCLGIVLELAEGYESVDHRVFHLINGAHILWTIVLLVGTIKGFRSSFVIMLIVLFPSVGMTLLSFAKNLTIKGFAATYLVSLALPALFMIGSSVRVFTVMIPMTARMGPHTNPEMIIGALAFLTSMPYLLQIVPLSLLMKKSTTFLVSLLFIHITIVVLVFQTSYGFPYRGNVLSPALQRFYVLHCERTFHDAKGAVRKVDSGFFVQSLDRNNLKYVTGFIPELEEGRPASVDCPKEIFCGFPVFTSRFIRPAPYSYWLPASPPTIHHPTSLEVVNQTQVLVNVRRIRILVTGPDHITVGLSPRLGVELVKWSLDDEVPAGVDDLDGRKTFMVYYSHGLMGGSLEFDLDLSIPSNHSSQVIGIAVVGHYMHDKNIRTNEFKSLLSRFPDWTHPTAWTTTYKSWEI